LVTSGRNGVGGSVVRLLDPSLSTRLNKASIGSYRTHHLEVLVHSGRKPSSEAVDTSHEAFFHGGLAKALDVLRYLSRVNRPVTPKELAEALGCKEGTIYAHLAESTKAHHASKNGDGTWSYATPTTEQLDEYAAFKGLTGRAKAADDRYADQRANWPGALKDLLEDQAKRLARRRSVHLVVDQETGELLPTYRTREEALAGRDIATSTASQPCTRPDAPCAPERPPLGRMGLPQRTGA
jgi:hypothetical protein